MVNLRKIIIFLVIAAFAAAGLLFYGFYHPQSASTPPASSNIKCLESAEYFVIDNNPGSPGLDLVAKHKTSPNEALSCADKAEVGDAVIQNDLPEFTLGLTGKFLVVDSGTAPPPRGLKIYNLDIQSTTFADRYSDPITIASGTVTYWEPITQAVTNGNCPGFMQYKAQGLGAVIESRIVLDLPSFSKTKLGEYRCVPTQ